MTDSWVCYKQPTFEVNSCSCGCQSQTHKSVKKCQKHPTKYNVGSSNQQILNTMSFVGTNEGMDNKDNHYL